jgi:adenosylcobinamide-phosphate guanylyltransferase
MMAVDAVVMAGGRGLRLRPHVKLEKPMINILGRPMIEYVVSAIRSSSSISEIYVVVSDSTPYTRVYALKRGLALINAPGRGYVEDLKYASSLIESRYVISCPADIPLITPDLIDSIVEAFYRSGKETLSILTPRTIDGYRVSTAYGVGGKFAFTGINVYDRDKLLSKESLSQGYMVIDDIRLALNINTIEDYRVAIKYLRELDGRI